jgi:hypothetical protein
MSVEYVENQTTVGEWADQTFGKADHPKRRPLRLLEEVIELCIVAGATPIEMAAKMSETLIKHDMDSNESRVHLYSMPEELADCQIVLDTIAHEQSVNLQLERDRKMNVNRGRLWSVTAAGVGQHK